MNRLEKALGQMIILTQIKKALGWLMIAIVMSLGVTMLAFPAAVTQIAGLAVAQSSTQWNNLRDMSVGDNLTSGVGLFSPCLWNGASCDRHRGSIANGALVDVTRTPGGNQTPADGFANPTTFQGTWSLSGLFNGTTWDRWRGQVFSAQGPTLLNTSTAGAANTAHIVTLTGVATTRIHLYKLKAACSPAGTSSVAVTDGTNTIYNSPAPAHPLSVMETWTSGLTIPTAANSVITLNACGTGNVGVLTIEADQF